MEIKVDVDVDEVLAAMSDAEIRAVAAERSEKHSDARKAEASEDVLWQRLRAAARTGDASAFLAVAEELAWAYHDTFLETSRLHLGRAA